MNDGLHDASHDYIEMVADIVSAYVSNNAIPASELSKIISSVYAAIRGLAEHGSAPAHTDEIEKPTPAQIKKSITAEALISFEDGRPYKTLKRHLVVKI